ncbi:MAG: hypothetical protein HFI44_13850 [Lachnospiraceae bacterium]|nr:hypothetical protein [Lachnospiraceae bacterium]
MRFYARKNRIFIIGSILLLLFAVVTEWLCAESDKSVMEDGKFRMSFSRESGFYEEPFQLEMTAGAGTIYYTLDGSIPTQESAKYEAPILIADATQKENTYSMRTDISVAFDREAVEKMSIEEPFPGYETPNYKIDKATVIRAALYDAQGQCRDAKTATYFVGFSDKEGYDGISTLSIVTDPANLFDYETGIYVSGKEYDDYVNEYRNQGIYIFREAYWSQWLANYKNRGIKWERKAVCQFFDATGEPVFEQECGIRIHGTSTRAYNPKSLNLYARKEYDGNKVFEADLFGTGYQPSAMTVFQGGNDVRTKAKDWLVSTAIKDLNVSALNYRPCVMFLNGEYWGVYWICEKYDARYLEYYYGVNKDNLIMVKALELAEGEEEDYKYYGNMVKFCSESDLTKDENYDKVCRMIDMESYIDYMAVMLYSARTIDWPSENYACWRVKKEEDGVYGDGKWRWMVFDMNSYGFYPELDSISWAMSNDDMFKNLMTNDTFKSQLISRIEELSDTVFEAEAMEKKLDDYRSFMAEAMRENDRRFYNDDSLAAFDREIEELKDFFYKRKICLEPILNSYRAKP